MNDMLNKYIVTLDSGTSSCRTLIIDHRGVTKAMAQLEFTQYFPHSGWVEHDPIEIWNTQKTTLLKAKQTLNIKSYDFAALGIANQRETIVMWDKSTGYPVYNAIVWQDGRTKQYCEDLIAKYPDLVKIIQAKTGLSLNPYFSASKIHWILKNVPRAQAVLAAGNLLVGTIDTWLIWNLTNGESHVTDVTNASRTLLFNIIDQEWDDELLAVFKIPRSILPQVLSSGDEFGEVNPQLFSPNAKGKIPITGVLGDQQAALFGQMCLAEGDIKCTYGTGCFVLINTGTKPVFSKNQLLTTIAWKIKQGPTVYALEGAVFSCGTSIQWLRDQMHFIEQPSQCDHLVQEINDDDQKVYFVPAFTGLGAPYWDYSARTTIFGIERGTTANHIIKAALEGMAYECNELIRCIEEDLNHCLSEVRVDGGAANSQYLMQFQASIINKKVIKPTNLETTALGATYMAGLAIGFWNNVDEIKQIITIQQTYTPQFDEVKRIKLLAGWAKAVQRSLGWLDQ